MEYPEATSPSPKKSPLQYLAWFFYGLMIVFPFIVRTFDWIPSSHFFGSTFVNPNHFWWWLFLTGVFSLGMYYFFKDKVFRFLFGLMIVLIPFVFDKEIRSVFTMPKLLTIRYFTFLFLITWAYKIYSEGFYRFIKSKLNRWLLIYGVISILTVIFSVQIYASLYGVHGRFIGVFTLLNFLFLAFLVFNTFVKRQHVQKFILIGYLTAVGTAIYGLGFNFGWWGKPEIWTQDPGIRLFGSMGHSNHFGAYLVFFLMIGAGLLFYFRKWWQRILLLLAEIIILLAIIETASRGALIALLISSFVFLIFLIKLKWKFIRRHKLKIATGFVVLGILLGFFHKPLFERVNQLALTERTVSTIQFILAGHVPDRISWWWSSLDMFRERPILGHGLSTYKDIYNQYRRLDYRVPGDIQDTITPESAHMEFFNVLATQGVVGLISYLAILVFFFWQMGRFIWRKTGKKSQRYLALGIMTAVTSYLSQVLMSFGVVSTMAFLYLFIGIGLALVNANQTEPLSPRKKTYNLYRYLVAIIIIFAAVFSMYHATKQYRAEFMFRQAQSAFKKANYPVAFRSYQEVNRLTNKEYVYYIEWADNAVLAASEPGQTAENIIRYLQDSEKAYLKALKINPTLPYVHANLALNYLIQKDVANQTNQPDEARKFFQKAIQEYQTAVEISPNNPLYPYNLGIIYFKNGKYSEAIATFNQVLEIRTPFQDTSFYLAYAYLKLDDLAAVETWQAKFQDIDLENEKYNDFLAEWEETQKTSAETEAETVSE